MLTRAKEQLIIYKSGGKSGFNPYIEEIDATSEEANFYERELDIDEEECLASDDDLITKDMVKYESLYAPLPSRSKYAYDYNLNTFKVYDDERDDLEQCLSDKKKLGSAAHRFCEAYDGDDFDKVFKATVDAYALSEREEKLLLMCAKNYEKFYKIVKNVKTYKEFEYYYIKDDIIYTGVIDRLDVYDDRVVITDYKLTSLDDNALKELYAKQMSMYVEAVKIIFKKDASARLFILSKDKFIDME